MKRSQSKKRPGHCPNCGDFLFDIEEVVQPTHHCDPAVLNRIAIHTDEAMTRDPSPKTRQSFSDRLSSGFAMMDDDYEPE